MAKELAMEIRGLNVTYRVMKPFSVKQSLLSLKKNEVKLVHAVKDLDLDVEKGEILGIVGRNGSGKSTLLSTMAGIFAPDSGTIDLHNNTISLLALGAGFNREVTGRENILLSGMLLGFSEKQIRAKMNEIIKFSELGEFIDMPVKTYSSGMVSKLTFSITANLETDIILLDEILSVGDAKFRTKSYNRMKEIVCDEDRTAIIVSHAEKTLLELCDRIMWMDEGRVRMIGGPEEVLEKYMEFMRR